MSDEGAVHAAYIRGVPHPLPAGEHVLWEGAPSARAIATHVFHRRVFALYFGAMLVWWAATTNAVFGSSEFLVALGVRAGLVAIVLAIVEVLARTAASTSWYAITNKRLVMKIGMVLPMSINIPFAIVQSAGLGTFKDGTGQIVLSLTPGSRIAYIALWPHCRVFQFNNPQPILRGLADAPRIGALLSAAVAEAAESDQNSRVDRTPLRGPATDVAGLRQPVGA